MHKIDHPQKGHQYSREAVLKELRDEQIEFLRMTFTDITGNNKNVEVPASQFEKALDGQVMFDGSSIEGFVRIEESDMLLSPDLDSFRILPWDDQGRSARLICDVHTSEDAPFVGCPRGALKRIIAKGLDMGFEMKAGIEAEFFLFEMDEDGGPTVKTHDKAGYFDLAPIDRGEPCRRAIVHALHSLGFEVEASHHEVAEGQHEIGFRYGDALHVADKLSTFRFVVRKIARDFGLHATFMPKPVFGINGSGMHTHQSLFTTDGNNAFNDPEAEYGLSKTAMHYIAGLLIHAKGLTAITNPLINSYKRLVPGYEAPTHIAWSEKNRSPLCRVPARRGVGTRVELRSPDPSCNPYLALAGMLASGLHGIEAELKAPAPVNKNLYSMSQRERSRHKVDSLPGNLSEAVTALEKDKLLKDCLGNHIFDNFVRAKRQEWQEYIAQVHEWELERYLSNY
ncbi:MAG: type I glutamate--ammonia ligase [Planctomycetota bacterium]|nr:MAG: type I glutamate--ammonia ligase [Planctomycetota bacterium]